MASFIGLVIWRNKMTYNMQIAESEIVEINT